MRYKLLLLVATSALLIASWSFLASPRMPNYPTKELTVDTQKFTLLVPQTKQQKQEGLAAVGHLPQNWGMLFEGKGTISLWMKGMKYPIDILWLDKDGKVIHLEHTVRPETYPKVFYNPAPSQANYAIELTAGQLRRQGVVHGAVLKLKQP